MELSEAVKLIMDHPEYFKDLEDIEPNFIARKFSGINIDIVEKKIEEVGEDSDEFHQFSFDLIVESRVNQIIYIASKLKDAVDKESM